jgi:hypothetical protein
MTHPNEELARSKMEAALRGDFAALPAESTRRKSTGFYKPCCPIVLE